MLSATLVSIGPRRAVRCASDARSSGVALS